MASVIFAYNSTDNIPSVGAQRVTYSVPHVLDTLVEVVGPSDDLADYSTKETVIGSRLLMRFKLGAGILKVASNRAFFVAFFKAKYRWAVSGDFKDTANSGNSNLCKCVLVDRRIEVSVEYDQDNGYELKSEKTF